MSLSGNSVFEIRTAGNDTNGGGFVTGATGFDYSLQDGKNTVGADISTTDAVAVGTGVITSVTANFGTTIVGNIIYLQGGTGTLAAGWYQVLSRASTISITVDRNVAAGTGITMNIGGALASPGMAGGVGLVTGMIFYIKSGTYTVTSASTNVTNGCFSSALTQISVEGYGSARGDLGAKPLIQSNNLITTFTLLAVTGAQGNITNVAVDGLAQTSSRGISFGNRVWLCSAVNCTNNGFLGAASNSVADRCTATGCTTQPAFTTGSFYNCIAYDNTITGFSGVTIADGCIADTNTGGSTDGFSLAIGGYARNCTSYKNDRNGFNMLAASSCVSCIAESNTGSGFQRNNNNYTMNTNCATYNNSGGAITATTGKITYNVGPITYTASAFVDGPNQNFALNNTTGGGASLRAAGYPGALPIGGTGYIDVGALQHQDAGSGYVPQVME